MTIVITSLEKLTAYSPAGHGDMYNIVVLFFVRCFMIIYLSMYRGGSRISGKGVHIYKWCCGGGWGGGGKQTPSGSATDVVKSSILIPYLCVEQNFIKKHIYYISLLSYISPFNMFSEFQLSLLQ